MFLSKFFNFIKKTRVFSGHYTPELYKSLKKGYSKDNFLSDLMSGTIVGVLALPFAIAFAIASGVSPEKGLYTAIIAGFLISVLGGTRFQIGGPTGAFIVIVFGIVREHGYDGLATATLMAGVMLVIFAFARFGNIIKFIPYPVTVGFTAGIAIIIALGQIPNFLGLSFPNGVQEPVEAFGKLALYISVISTINVYSLLIGFLALVILIYWPKFSSKIPGSLVAIIVTTALVQIFNLDEKLAIATIGSKNQIPTGFPMPSFPNISLEMMRKMFQPALTIAILGAIESLLSAVVADGMTGHKHRSNTELLGQGVANIFSPIFGGIPATGAIARTATNIRNGAFSPISGVVHALVLLLIMLVLGKYAEMIPMAALAAILFQVAFNMSGYKSFIKLFKAPKGDVSVLVVTFSLTILLDLTVAIQVGLLMAAVFFIHRMSEVSQVDFVSGILKDDENNEDSDDFYNLSSRSIPKGVEVFEISGSLFFGAVDKFKETLDQQSKQPRVLILRMRQVQSIDASGLQMIEDLLERLRGFGTQLLLSGVEAQPIVALNRSGLMHELGEKNVLANIDAALNRAREILGESLLEYSEKQSSQSVSWEVNLEKPWLPDQANALIAKETTEVITEKVLEDIEEKEHQNKKETNPENLD